MKPGEDDDAERVVGFTRSYLGWRGRVALNRLQRLSWKLRILGPPSRRVEFGFLGGNPGTAPYDLPGPTLYAGEVPLTKGAFADPRLADDTVKGLSLSARGIVASRGDLSGWSLSGGAFELAGVKGTATPQKWEGNRVTVAVSWTPR